MEEVKLYLYIVLIFIAVLGVIKYRFRVQGLLCAAFIVRSYMCWDTITKSSTKTVAKSAGSGLSGWLVFLILAVLFFAFFYYFIRESNKVSDIQRIINEKREREKVAHYGMKAYERMKQSSFLLIKNSSLFMESCFWYIMYIIGIIIFLAPVLIFCLAAGPHFFAMALLLIGIIAVILFWIFKADYKSRL